MEPGLREQIPPPKPASGHQRVVAPSYLKLLRMVEMGYGVAVIPGWYPFLNDCVSRGRLWYRPILQFKPFLMQVYLGRGGEISARSQSIRSTLETSLKKAAEQRPVTNHQLDMREYFKKHPVEEHEYLYSVSSDIQTRQPVWLRGHMRLNANDKLKIRGLHTCLLYTSPSPRDQRGSRMPSSA